jgi:translation initiation factor IF-2
MAVKLVDLADKLGIKVAELRDYIDYLDLDIPKSAHEASDEKAKVLEEEILKDIGEDSLNLDSLDLEDESDIGDDIEGSDGKQTDGGEKGIQEEEEVEEDEGLIVDIDELSKTEQVEEELAAEMERETVKKQRKSMAGKHKDDKKKKKKQVAGVGHEVEESAMRVKAGDKLEIPAVTTVKEFAERSGIPIVKVIGELMKNGILASINQQIDFDTAEVIAHEFDVQLVKKREEVSVDELMGGDFTALLEEHDKSALQERPPVVVIMGHVDHGKTQLLDTIRQTDVVAGESGGITQHIGAYQVKYKEKTITFLDTPGHEAFTEMRARGARVTDVAILVVAADEGVKPQTEEAYAHMKESGVGIIVAVNKIDKENANIDKVKSELGSKLSIELEEWGGDIPLCPVSALTGEGIDDLLDHVAVMAEVMELKANPNRNAVGTVIESHLNKSLGPIATVLVQTGTLQLMDNVVVGGTYGRIKKMTDWHGKNLKAVGPSGPVRIAGLNEVPHAGEVVMMVKDEKTARVKAKEILIKQKMIFHANTMTEIISRIQQGQMKALKVVLKADTQGSLEAIKNSLEKIESTEVRAQVIHSGIGAISLNDIYMAASSAAVVLGFHVKLPVDVEKRAEMMGVEVRKYKIIYKLIEEVKMILEGLLDPEVIEVELGEAEVLQIFFSKRREMIIGCKVKSGKMVNKAKLRVSRNGEFVGEGMITSLQKGQENVDEVKEGHECGIKFEGKFKIEEGDTLEAYEIEKRKRTLG